MAGEIGSVKATFTASAAGLVGPVNDSIRSLGSFAAAQRRVEAQTSAYGMQSAKLATELASGAITADDYADRLGRIQNAFKNIGEYERLRVGLEGIRAAAAAGAITVEQERAAADKLAASVSNATPATERLSAALAKNRADFLAGAITSEQYRETIARLPGQINGVETEQQRMDRIFKESRETLRSLKTPTDAYRESVAKLDEQLAAGAIDEQQYAEAVKKAKTAMDGVPEKTKSVGDALGNLPGPLGGAARLFETFRTSLSRTTEQFRAGGITGGLRGLAADLGGGLANAASTGGQSLVAIAPQLALVAGGAVAAGAAIRQIGAALAAVGSDVERTGQLAARLGVSFQEFEVLGAAASTVGVSTEALGATMTKFLRTTDQAREGSDKAMKGFASLGFSIDEVRGKDPTTLMQEAAQRISAIEDPAKRASAAISLFGRSGNNILPALANIEQTREQMAALGGTMRQVDVDRFENLDDAFDRMGIATQRLGRTLLVPFTEMFTKLADGVAFIAGGVSSALSPWADFAATILGAATNFDVVGKAINLTLRASGALTQLWMNGIAGLSESVAQSETLGVAFRAAYASVDVLWQGLRGIGGVVEFVVRKLEEWAGIKVGTPDFKGVNEDALADAMDAAGEGAGASQEKLAKDLQSRAKSIAESLLTPMQRYSAAVAEAQALESKGLLTAQQRIAYETKLRDEMVAQDPARKQAMKYAEDQKKAVESITAEMAKAREAGSEFGAAGAGIRSAFLDAAAGIRSDLAQGLIDPEMAKEQMRQIAEDMKAELDRVGQDWKFAERVREELASAGEKLRQELDQIEQNPFLTRDQKNQKQGRVIDAAQENLPGGPEKANDPISRFNADIAELRAALQDGIISQSEAMERAARVREDLVSEGQSVLDDRADKERSAKDRQNNAVMVNSNEGASELFRLLRGSRDEPSAKQLAELKKSNTLLAGVKAALEGMEVIEIK